VDHVYTVITSNGPQAAYRTLDNAQAAVTANYHRYTPTAELRWDEDTNPHVPRTWELKIKGKSGRWAKAYVAVRELPLI
jgi:hypothetical protein